MSEYQYYEFQAVDRPLEEEDVQALEGLSTRAQITATSFVNHYNWGDFRGNPQEMVERWFDLHLYLANWGTRRLMIRTPKRFVNRSRIRMFLREVDWVRVRDSGRNWIVDIWSHDEEREYVDLDDGHGWLGALAPLRSDVLMGDLRLFYLLWLTAVEAGDLKDDEKEPLPGIGPLTGPLEAFANFFHIDGDLVQAAGEAPMNADLGKVSAAARHRAVEAIPDAEKTALLRRLVDGDPHVSIEVQRKVLECVSPPAGEGKAARRTVADLRVRATEIREERRAEAARRREAERRRKAEQEERARRKRLKAVRRRGESVWGEIETEILRRNASAYGRAASLIFDLGTLAEEDGTKEKFLKRVRSIRHRHARKRAFLARLGGLALDQPGSDSPQWR